MTVTIKLIFEFIGTAVWTWRKLSSVQNSRFSYGEETITEIIIKNLHYKCSPELQIIPFNKIEEGKGVKRNGKVIKPPTGADWEFCFCGSAGYLSVRVQAKKLSKTGSYEGVKNKSNPKQWRDLRTDALRVGAIPIYVFYNGKPFLPKKS